MQGGELAVKHIPSVAVGQKYRVGLDVWEIVDLNGPDPAYRIVTVDVEVSESTRAGWARYYDQNPGLEGTRDEFLALRRTHEVEPRWFLRADVGPA